jgi:hypothetical protein
MDFQPVCSEGFEQCSRTKTVLGRRACSVVSWAFKIKEAVDFAQRFVKDCAYISK